MNPLEPGLHLLKHRAKVSVSLMNAYVEIQIRMLNMVRETSDVFFFVNEKSICVRSPYYVCVHE